MNLKEIKRIANSAHEHPNLFRDTFNPSFSLKLADRILELERLVRDRDAQIDQLWKQVKGDKCNIEMRPKLALAEAQELITWFANPPQWYTWTAEELREKVSACKEWLKKWGEI